MTNKKFQKYISERTKVLAKDPSKLATFLGYVGESKRKGYVRLYVTPKYDFWIDILEDHIHFIEDISTEKFQLGGNVVWVKKRPDIIANFKDIRELVRDGGPFGDLSDLGDPAGSAETQFFGTTMVCATIAITYNLCLTPSCSDTTIHPIACRDDDDDDDEGGEGTDPDKDGDDDEPEETEGSGLF